MKLFSSKKIQLFKLAAEPAESPSSFEELAATVNAGEAPEMTPEDFEAMPDSMPEEISPQIPTEPIEDPVMALKHKLISVLGEDDDVKIKEEENLEEQTHSITDES